VTYAYFFRLYPASSLVDDIRSHDSPLANLMTVIDFSVHIHTVGINVQMENATFRITMQGDYVASSRRVRLVIFFSFSSSTSLSVFFFFFMLCYVMGKTSIQKGSARWELATAGICLCGTNMRSEFVRHRNFLQYCIQQLRTH